MKKLFFVSFFINLSYLFFSGVILINLEIRPKKNAGVIEMNYDHIKNIAISEAKKYNIPAELVLSVIKCESNFDIMAKSNNISDKGQSLGLMQLSSTYRKTWKYSDFFDPEKNIDDGCKTLADCMRMSKGNIEKALVYYNFGYGNAEIKKKPIPQMTKNYIAKVLKNMKIYSAELKKDEVPNGRYNFWGLGEIT
jgi:soluble lytic murein transglycosylase-like protein